LWILNKYLQDVGGFAGGGGDEKSLVRSNCYYVAEVQRRFLTVAGDGGVGERDDDGAC